jgi:Tol biopolymer transport system component
MRVQTEEGAIVGTVAYMSPEQAEGRTMDARSDIFSFGAVLYEMVTGRRAFQRGSRALTLAAVLREDPRPASEVAGDLPRDLEKVITRCLRKDPGRRFQHMADVKVALAELKEESESEVQPAAVAAGRSSRRWIWAVAAIALLAGAAAWRWGWPLVRPTQPPRLTPLTSYIGIEEDPDFSPDGRQVVFAWDGETRGNFDIYVKLIGSEPPLRLTTDPAYDAAPAWSPDGQWIAFTRRAQGAGAPFQVVLVPPLGGPERKVGDFAGGSLGPGPNLAWTPDSKGLIVPTVPAPGAPAAIAAVSIATGERRQLTHPPAGSGGDAYPAVSPDGRKLAFLRSVPGAPRVLYTVASSEHGEVLAEPRRLDWTAGCSYFCWTADGRGFVCSALTPELWLVKLSATRRSSPDRLAFGEEGLTPAVARSGGKLAYMRRKMDIDIWRMSNPEHGLRGQPAKLITSTRLDDSPVYSPDGRWIAFRSDRSGRPEIWVARDDGTGVRQLTSCGIDSGCAPRWSPDGRSIASCSSRDLFRVDAQGGVPLRLTQDKSSSSPSYSPEGKWLYFSSTRASPEEVRRMPAGGGEGVQITRGGGANPLITGNGRWLFFTRRTPDQRLLLLATTADGGDERQVAELIYGRLQVAVADHGAYFVDGGNWDQHPSIVFYDAANGQTRRVAELGNARRWTGTGLSVSPDGRWFTYALSEFDSDLMLVENFR